MNPQSNIPVAPALDPVPVARVKLPGKPEKRSIAKSHRTKLERFKKYVEVHLPRIDMTAKSCFTLISSVYHLATTLRNAVWTITRGSGNTLLYIVAGYLPLDVKKTWNETALSTERTGRAVFTGFCCFFIGIVKPERARKFFSDYGVYRADLVTNKEKKKDALLARPRGKIVASDAVKNMAMRAPGAAVMPERQPEPNSSKKASSPETEVIKPDQPKKKWFFQRWFSRNPDSKSAAKHASFNEKSKDALLARPRRRIVASEAVRNMAFRVPKDA